MWECDNEDDVQPCVILIKCDHEETAKSQEDREVHREIDSTDKVMHAEKKTIRDFWRGGRSLDEQKWY